MRMNTKAIVTPSNEGILAVLNANRITENRQKEAIMTMGLDICNVKCLSLEIGKGKYISKV